MDSAVRFALKRQFLATLAMFRQCVERCPEDVWTSGRHPRNYWRIAYHAAFYADLYSGPGIVGYQPCDLHDESATDLWEDANPPERDPYTREQILDFVDAISARAPRTLDHIDLDSPETGFPWYPGMSKIEHEILCIRHLAGHVGQLSELLMARGIDIDWVGGGKLKID